MRGPRGNNCCHGCRVVHTHIQTITLFLYHCIYVALTPNNFWNFNFFFFHLHTTTSSARVAICTLQIALTFLWFFGMESEKKGFFAPPMAFQPSVHTVTWLECLGSCHVAQFMSLHAKNGCWVKKRTNLVRGTLWAGRWGHRGGWRETRVDYFPRWKFFQWKVTWDLTMKKKSNILESHMNIEWAYNFTHRKSTNYIIYACGQCYSMSKLVILHSLKWSFLFLG